MPPSSANPAPAAAPDLPPSLLDHALPLWRHVLVGGLLLALPFIASYLEQDFYLLVASRVLVFALAATSLNLILGFGGMVSFGHAAFVGIGAYSVAILAQHGITQACLAWPIAVLVSALFAGVIGSISLRTKGVYFIMITLAFAQMVYYLMVTLKAYGGEDGLALAARSQLGGGVDLHNDATFYWVVLSIFVAGYWLVYRLVNSRWGHSLQAIRENEPRMLALGYPVFRIKWLAFVLAGGLAGLAGALLANQNSYVSPAMMHWSQSGMLMVMVILGGVGLLAGPLAGAAAFLILEELLTTHTVHWQLALGAMLLLVVLVAPNGILSWRRRRGNHG